MHKLNNPRRLKDIPPDYIWDKLNIEKQTYLRLDIPGTLHHVIIRGIERRRIADDRKDQDRFVTRMGQLASDTGTAIYAWALMASHAHILLRSGTDGLSNFMRHFLPNRQRTRQHLKGIPGAGMV